jgi:hypothetical protein
MWLANAVVPPIPLRRTRIMRGADCHCENKRLLPKLNQNIISILRSDTHEPKQALPMCPTFRFARFHV